MLLKTCRKVGGSLSKTRPLPTKVTYLSGQGSTVHAARRSVRVKAADQHQAHYSGRDAAAVVLQSARESAKAFDEAMYRKSALLQQRCEAGGWQVDACADKCWSGGDYGLAVICPCNSHWLVIHILRSQAALIPPTSWVEAPQERRDADPASRAARPFPQLRLQVLLLPIFFVAPRQMQRDSMDRMDRWIAWIADRAGSRWIALDRAGSRWIARACRRRRRKCWEIK